MYVHTQLDNYTIIIITNNLAIKFYDLHIHIGLYEGRFQQQKHLRVYKQYIPFSRSTGSDEKKES